MQQLEDNTLLIEKVKREDAGTYICHAQIKGRPITQQLRVSVVINGRFLLRHQLVSRWKLFLESRDKINMKLELAVPPTVHLKEEEKKVVAGPETNVTLLCLVEGIPPPIINWTL